MNTTEYRPDSSSRRRRWYRYGLWALLLFVLICVILCSWFAIVTIQRATKQQEAMAALEKRIASAGTNLLLIMPGTAANGSTALGAASQTTLTLQDADEIALRCPAISQVAPVVRLRAHLSYGNRHWHPTHFTGTTPSFLTACKWEVVAEGAAFTDVDVRNATKVCLIGETVKRELFQNESPIGKTIRVQNDAGRAFGTVDFQVIGVLGHKGSDIWSMDQDDIVLVPWTTVEYQISAPPHAATPQLTRLVKVDQILAKAASAEEVSQAIRQITERLRKRHRIGPGQNDDFHIRDINEQAKAIERGLQFQWKLLPKWKTSPGT